MAVPDPSAPEATDGLGFNGGPTGTMDRGAMEVAQSTRSAEPPEEVILLPGNEPTAAEVVEELIAALPPQPIPLPPIPLPVTRRGVHGRYLGTAGLWRLELRVDVDGV